MKLAARLLLIVALCTPVFAQQNYKQDQSLVTNYWDSPGLWVQIPYGIYTNNYQQLGGAPEANKGIVLRYWNDRNIIIRHLNFYNGRPRAGAKIRMAIYTYDGSALLLDSGLIDVSGPTAANIQIDLAAAFSYDKGYYWVWQATTDALYSGLGILPGTEYNTPLANGGKLPTLLDGNLTPPASFDSSTITAAGGYQWAFAGQS